MNSEISTKPPAAGSPARDDAGFQPWHFFLLMAMAAATVGVMLSKHTEPVALILLSAAILAAGLVAAAVHHAGMAFLTAAQMRPLANRRRREVLMREKQHVLHAIKELEFDHRMNKVNAADYQMLLTPLRVRAMTLIKDMDAGGDDYRGRIDADIRARVGDVAMPPAVTQFCAGCGAPAEQDARFCKSCGRKL